MRADDQKTILLVEDEELLAMVEKEILENFGYNVIMVNSGEGAVATVEKTPAIDLVLMDINLGAGIDGTEAAVLILRQRDIPVVFLSSHTEPEIVEKTEKITSYGYVVKGSGAPVLRASIKMAFKLFEAKIKEQGKESQLEAALKAQGESELKHRVLVENINDVLYTLDAAGNFTYISPVIERLSGRKPEEIVGRNFAEFVHPDDLPALIEKFKQTMGGVRESFEFRVLNGEEIRHVRTSSQRVVRDGVVTGITGLMSDISERMHEESQKELALTALRESEIKYRELVENLNDVVFSVDISGRISYISPAITQITGYTPEEITGRNLFDFFSPEDKNRYVEQMQVTANKGNSIGEFSITVKDKSVKWISSSSRCVMENGKVVAIRGIMSDISERKRVEEEIIRQLAEKEILLREVHHRIRNNIASIGGLLSLHLKSVTHPEAIAVLQDAIGRVDSMGILYDKLLLSEGYKDVSVKNYVESLADTVIALFPGNVMVKLEKNIDDFHLDPKRLFPLGIIINELITNKMKYAFNQKKTGWIRISLVAVEKHVTLAILDNGARLPDGFAVDSAKGFGLTLVKMLTKQLGGKFSIEKKAGTRCTVEFDI